MDARDLAGAVLVSGLVIFLVGAVRWRLAYEGPPAESMPVVHADRRRRAWIHLWMIVAMPVTPAGLAAFATVADGEQSRALGAIAAVIYTMGAAFWVVALAFRLTVVPAAAEHVVVTGSLPPGFTALDAWAGSLFVIHLLAAYCAFGVLGIAVLFSEDLPGWLGWLGLAWGAAFFLGISAGGRFSSAFYPPFWAHGYPALVGLVLLTT